MAAGDERGPGDAARGRPDGEHDVIVVGAGPAGCSAAAFLGARGLRVLLLDRATFPRDKTCGDAISPHALSLLDRLGVGAEVDARGFRIDGVTITAPDGHRVQAPLLPAPGLRDHGCGLPRVTLDALLLARARSLPGVEVREGCQVRSLAREGVRVRGVHAEGAGWSGELRAPLILGADGARSVVARGLGLANADPRHTAVGMRGYLEGVRGIEPNLEIYYRSDLLPAYAWIIPTGPTSANVGVSVMTRFASARDVKELFHRFLDEDEHAREKLAGARLVPGSRCGWPLPFGSFRGRRAAGNVLLLGDAGSLVDPISGEGIYYALRSGELAADAAAEALAKGAPEAAGDAYDRLRRRAFRGKYFLGYRMQALMHREPLLNWSLARASRDAGRAQEIVDTINLCRSKARLLL